jgi:hypothetical protein
VPRSTSIAWLRRTARGYTRCFLDGRDVLLTNGYDKKAEKVRRQEIDRATRIRASWRA